MPVIFLRDIVIHLAVFISLATKLRILNKRTYMRRLWICCTAVSTMGQSVHAPCAGGRQRRVALGKLQTSRWRTARRARHFGGDAQARRTSTDEQRDSLAARSVRVTISTFSFTIGAFLGWAKVLLKQYRAILGPPPLLAGRPVQLA
jgi:hypothetical protein